MCHQRIYWKCLFLALEGYLTDVQQPNIFAGLQRVVSPLFNNGPEMRQRFEAASSSETLQILKVANAEDSGFVLPQCGVLLTLPLLAQLATFLPADLAFDTSTVVYSAHAEHAHFDSIHSLITEREKPFLVLISAQCGMVGFGAFFGWKDPQHDILRDEYGNYASTATILFQYKPVHRVFSSSTVCSQPDHTSPTSPFTSLLEKPRPSPSLIFGFPQPAYHGGLLKIEKESLDCLFARLERARGETCDQYIEESFPLRTIELLALEHQPTGILTTLY